MIDYADLESRRRDFAAQFRSAAPFPWLMIDDFLAPAMVQELTNGFGAAIRRANKNPDAPKKHKHVLRKIGLIKPEMMEEAHRCLFRELASDRFLDFLSSVTGIKPLYADASLNGGGLHEIYPGGYLNVHTDFNIHPESRRHRRLNILIYLNPEWDEVWGGALELWPADNSRAAVSILPVGGRMVLFETSEISFHGHPTPLACPEGVTRRSLAAYYYSDWPAEVSPREKTNYRLTPAQRTVLKQEVIAMRQQGRDAGHILVALSARYQPDDIQSALKALP
jgi:Rps23 Pro-64 3,4-dihydroxylase Tpa1-like proline 4-hydroxylase